MTGVALAAREPASPPVTRGLQWRSGILAAHQYLQVFPEVEHLVHRCTMGRIGRQPQGEVLPVGLADVISAQSRDPLARLVVHGSVQ